MAIKVNGTTVIDDSRNLVNIASGLGGSPAGSIVYHAGNTAPSGYVKANGASLSTSTYADLFAAIGYTFGGSGGSFNVPDLRGEFLRGWDDSRGVDSGRSFGTTQSDQMESHNHLSGTVSYSGQTHKYGTVSSSGYSSTGSDSVSRVQSYTSTTGGTSNSSETRPRNIALLACIKY